MDGRLFVCGGGGVVWVFIVCFELLCFLCVVCLALLVHMRKI